MFCKNCGTQLEENSAFCPKCGTAVLGVGGNGPEPVGKNGGNGAQKPKKKKWLLPVGVAAVIVILIGALSSGGSSDDADKVSNLITEVRNGYLGHYDTVPIEDALSYIYGDGVWDGGKASAGEYYIVEFSSEYIIIQFAVYDGEETFSVCGFEIPGVEETYKAYDIKRYLDSVYSVYAGAYPEYGLVIDESTDNNTLEGHFGPVKSVEDSAYARVAENEDIMETVEEAAEETSDASTVEGAENTAFNLSRVDGRSYINGTDGDCYEIYFYIEDGCIMFSVYQNDIDLVRYAEAIVENGSTLHFEGWADWNVDFVWNNETSFTVTGTGGDIADMIGTEFFDMTSGDTAYRENDGTIVTVGGYYARI